MVTGAGVDGCGAGPGREVVVVGEAGDVADFDEQSGRTRGADAVQAGQARAGRGEPLSQLLVRGLLARIDPLEVADQLGRNAATDLAGDVPGPDGREQLLGL